MIAAIKKGLFFLLATLIFGVVGFAVYLSSTQVALAATSKEAVVQSLSCKGASDAAAAARQELEGGIFLTYACSWQSLNYPNWAQYTVRAQGPSGESLLVCQVYNSGAGCSEEGCSCRTEPARPQDFKYTIEIVGGDVQVPSAVNGEEVSRGVVDAYAFLKNTSTNEFITGSQMREADRQYAVIQGSAKNDEEKKLLVEADGYIKSIRVKRATTIECQRDRTSQQCLNYDPDNFPETNPEDTYYQGSASFSGEEEDATCSGSAGSDLAALVAGSWFKNLGCALANGLIGLKSLIIDRWLLQGDTDAFGNVLNVPDPTLSTGSSSLVLNVWGAIRNLINALVLIALLVMALLNATGSARSKTLESFQFQRLIPSIVLGVILVNFSLAIVNFFIIAANAITNFLVAGLGGDGFSELLKKTGSGATELNNIDGLEVGPALIKSVALVAFSIIALYLYILLWVRLIVISLLAMTSALPYVARILPFDFLKKQVAGEWVKQFTNWLMMGPAVALLLYIASQAIGGIGQVPELALPNDLKSSVGTEAASTLTFTNLFIVAAILYVAATYPLKLGGKFMGTVQGLLKKATDNTGTFARRTAKGIAVAGGKEDAGRLTKIAGKAATTGLFIGGLPKYLNEQYKKIEEDRDKKLGKSWDKNKGVIGRTRRFVTNPLLETEIDEGSDKLLKTNVATLVKKASKPDKGDNDQVTWKDRAKAIMALKKKYGEATPEEQEEILRAWQSLGINKSIEDIEDDDIYTFARQKPFDAFAEIPGTSLAEKLRSARRNQMDRLDPKNISKMSGALRNLRQEYLFTQADEDKVREMSQNILSDLTNLLGEGNLNATDRFTVERRVRHGDGGGLVNFLRAQASKPNPDGTPRNISEAQISAVVAPMVSDTEYSAAAAQIRKSETNKKLVRNIDYLADQLDTSYRASEVRRLDATVSQLGITPDRAKQRLADDVAKLEQARSRGWIAAQETLKEIDRPAYDNRAGVKDGVAWTDMSPGEIDEIIQAKKDVLTQYGDKDSETLKRWREFRKPKQSGNKKKK